MVGFEKNKRYTPNAIFIVPSSKANKIKGTEDKNIPKIALIEHKVAIHIMDIPCTK